MRLGCDIMPRRVLITGGSGYVATLIAAALIESTDCHVVATVRSVKSLFDLEERVRREVSADRRPEVKRQFRAVCLHRAGEQYFAECLREHKISQIVHCAGSVDYSDLKALVAANVELTSIWLAAARSHGVDRFLHISTAFSAGSNNDGLIREELHPEPENEPTVYTKTKRDAERLVSKSGIPFVILRPSILVGHSTDGHYGGKPYGVYQFWKCAERLLSDRWRPHLHVVAPQQPIHVLHQDHLMRAFVAVFKHAPSDSIVNVVSEEEVLPSCRDVWNLYAAQCLAPDSVTFYDTLQDVPLARIDPRNRAFLKSVSANVEINSLRWRFDTTHLRRFCELGYEIPRATLESLSVCQRSFVASSSALTHFMHNHSSRFSSHAACHSRPGDS